MPPKAKITKEMILNASLEITREIGFEMVNARSIANKLKCSTRPIFTCYENMDELKKEFLDFVYEYYERYVTDYQDSAKVSSYLMLPLSYIEFAQEEPFLFKLLFIDDMELKMITARDFYKEIDNEEKAKAFAEAIGIDRERAKAIFLDLFLYSHGIAVLTTTQKMMLGRDDVKKMVENVLSAFIKQEQQSQDTSK